MSRALRRMRYAAWRIRSIRSARSSGPAVVCGVLSDVIRFSSSLLCQLVAGPVVSAAAGRPGDGALEQRDLLALRRAPGLAGYQRGEQPQQAVAAEQQRRADPAGRGVER